MDSFPTPPDERQTLDLVRRMRNGDDDAWNDLYRRYHDELLLSVRANLGTRLRSVLQSEDVLQSVALEAFKAMPGFEDRGAGSLRGFLNRLIVNKIRDRARAFGAQKRRGAVPLTDTVVAGIAADGEPTYLDERYDRLERALQNLPDEMRQVIVLRKIDGLSSQDVAERMGKSDDAARKLYSRAMARLSLLVSAAGGDGPS